MRFNVAIAENHRIFRRSFIRFIQDYSDIKVVFDASNSRELMHQLTISDNIDVLILDMQSKEMDGLKSWQIIQKQYPKIQIIILSHLNDDFYLEYAVHTEVLGYFTKDSDPKDLLNAIRKAGSGDFCFEEKFSSRVASIISNISDKNKKNTSAFDFSQRELDIIYWTAKEFKSKEIADKLNISRRTVEGHKDKLIKKTNSKSFLGVILIAFEKNLISIYNNV